MKKINKKYCLIGLSQFNYEIGKILKKEEQQVAIVDSDKKIIDSFGHEFDTALVCDATNINSLEEVGVDFYDYFIVGINDIEKSITICSNLKELNAKKIISKSKNLIHQRILKTMGITLTCIPEIEIAAKFAYQSIYDLNLEMFTFDVTARDSFLISLNVYNQEIWTKKICEISFLKNFSATIISIKRFNGEIIIPVTGEDVIMRSDKICILTKQESIKKLEEYFTKNIAIN